MGESLRRSKDFTWLRRNLCVPIVGAGLNPLINVALNARKDCKKRRGSEEDALVLGLARKSKYEELERENDESKAYMNVLTGQIEALRSEAAELGKELKRPNEELGSFTKKQKPTNSKRKTRRFC
jgi:predicted nuclease with TOPRIM domain